ncbi:MAG: hypothetical protein JNK57_03395 [Planctomycetaceae bacterium]|nr:hypothetical protein [Planctomycetaceae bacterium]
MLAFKIFQHRIKHFFRQMPSCNRLAWFWIFLGCGVWADDWKTNQLFAAVRVQDLDENGGPVTLDPELQRRVRLLLRQLNADELGQRDQAERDLLAIGSKLLDYLPPELESQSAELKERLTRVRVALETRTAAEVTKPLAIDLQGEFDLPQLLEIVRQQTNNTTVAAIADERRLSVDWKGVSYWAAMDEVMDRLQLTFDADQSQGVMLSPAVDRASRRTSASYHGAFRVSPTRLQYSRDLTSSLPPQLQFALQLEWEPKLRVIRLDLPLDSVEILNPADPAVKQVVGGEGERVGFGVTNEKSGARANFAWPNLDAWETKTVDVRGKFNLLVAGREETFRFENLKSGLENKQTIDKSGIKVQLEEVSYDEHLMLLKIGIQFSDAKQSLESHLGWIYQNQIEIRDREGQSHAYLTIESGGRREQGLSLVYIFDRFDDLEGLQLIYRSPGILMESEVPFHLKDIPLR